jgi:hypothetical protein
VNRDCWPKGVDTGFDCVGVLLGDKMVYVAPTSTGRVYKDLLIRPPHIMEEMKRKLYCKKFMQKDFEKKNTELSRGDLESRG